MKVLPTTADGFAVWGPPDRLHVTITAARKSEQWSYGAGQSLCFENGVLKTIQRSQ